MELADDPRSAPSPNRAHQIPPAARYAPPPARALQARPSSSSASGLPIIVGAVLAIAALGAGGYILFGRTKPSPSANQVARGTPPAGGVERACEASRQQIKNGAALSPVDTYGWVVELWLARDDGSALTPTDPSIAHFRASDGSLDPALGLKLLPQDRGEVTFAELASPQPFEGKEPGVVIRLAGGYAAAFFASDTRPAFLKLADTAFDESKASVGALYARCGHLPYHDIGVWFRGRDPQAVADAIGFQMGGYAEAPWVARSVYSPIGKDGTSLESYRRKRVAVDSQLFGDEVRLLAGGEEESEAKGTTVIFPLATPLRALSMARWVTKQSNLD